MTDLSKTFKLTVKEFETFKDEFMYWVEKYGLKDWEYHFYFEAHEDDVDARAFIRRDVESRIALVSLDKQWIGLKPIEYEIRRAAYHEANEMLLSKINDIARRRSIMSSDIEEAVHEIIRRLENTYFDNDLNLRKKK